MGMKMTIGRTLLAQDTVYNKDCLRVSLLDRTGIGSIPDEAGFVLAGRTW